MTKVPEGLHSFNPRWCLLGARAGGGGRFSNPIVGMTESIQQKTLDDSASRFSLQVPQHHQLMPVPRLPWALCVTDRALRVIAHKSSKIAAVRVQLLCADDRQFTLRLRLLPRRVSVSFLALQMPGLRSRA